MFQNIDGMGKNPSTNGTFNTSKALRIKQVLGEVFKVNNIVLYILALLISGNSIIFEHVLLGVAFVASCISTSIPLIGVVICTIIGTIIGHGVFDTITLIAIMLILFVISSIFKPKVAVIDKNEGIKLGSRLVISCLFVFMVKELSNNGFWTALFFSFIDCSITYVFYKIFVNGIAVIRDIFDKRAFAIEEYLACVLTIVMAFSVGLTRLTRLGEFAIAIQSIVICILLMWIALKNKPIVSCLAGFVAGLIMILVNVGYTIYIPVMMVAGILGSGLSHFTRNNWTKKIYTAVGFIIGSLLVSYLLKINIQLFNFDYMFNLISCIIGFIILLFIPSNANVELEDLVGKIKMITDFKDNRLKPSMVRNEEEKLKHKKIVINKNSPDDNNTNNNSEKINNEQKKNSLEDLDSLFDLMVEIPKESYEVIDETKLEAEKQEKRKQNYIQDVLDNIEELRENLLFEQLSEDERIVADCYDILNQENIIANQDFVKILENYNNYVFLTDETVKHDLEEIIIVLNRTYQNFKLKTNK